MSRLFLKDFLNFFLRILNSGTVVAGVSPACVGICSRYGIRDLSLAVGSQVACTTAFAQKNNRDEFFHRQPRAFCQPLIPVQTAPCIGRESSPASVAEFSDR